MSEQSLEFGKKVKNHVDALAAEGKDANQIAKIICDADPQGYNYGIGIILDTDGQAMATSETLLKYVRQEIDGSDRGDYRNSTALMAELKTAILKWQRVPEAVWDSAILALPSDAGTGAVSQAIEIALGMNHDLGCIGVEELAWPGYKAMARTCRIGYKELASNCIIDEPGMLPVYQAGPQNTTGQVVSKDVVAERAVSATRGKHTVVLDRAYSGFEFASQLETSGYDSVMRRSYEQQVASFVEQGVPTLLAISPTKCFRSFALRPAGMVLAFIPDPAMRKQVTSLANVVTRARGSAFEHPVTRAFVRAMVNEREQLERDHSVALQRLAEAERVWSALLRGTAIEPLFSDSFSGLFRNPSIQAGADIQLYDEHIYPVIAAGRCRINVTGIPSDQELQQKHANAFARSCYMSQ